MKTRTFVLITLIAMAVLCIGAAFADVADGTIGDLPKITIGDAAPKTHKGATAMLHAVRATEQDVLLIWAQQGKKTSVLKVPAVAVPHLAPDQVGRTREFFAFVEGEGKAKVWVAFELVPEGAP